ncbi:magnesium chelatase domain-containing protein [Desulfobacter postgatei]|uniref:Lon proteolytic domain-containing protein n=1 Tax=Desulfobacter postgatei 2ac9 TaxID=879212 RepID=I5B4I5_9BACT|nr:magnesium chelatase domain-containing protein [Desulfobacter postgatei]EIM64398.1 hypothetical protein DespoDRAFT_02552 [Desulfobacter postgatei 2ac9]
MSPAFNIRSLAFAAEKNTGHFQAMVTDLACVPWCDIGRDDFCTCFENMISHMNDPALKQLFELSLGANFLIASSRPAWIRDFLTENTGFVSMPGHDIGVLEQGKWIKIPILLANDHCAGVVWFIAGLVALKADAVHIPEWAAQMMDARFIDAIDTAEQVVRRCAPDPLNHRFILFPVSQISTEIRFTGGSASLPIALGLKSLLQGTPLSKRFIATGCLDNSGNVRPVAYLDAKLKASRDRGFTCVILPAENHYRINHSNKGIIPVSSMDQAWTMVSLYSEKQENLLFFFSRALQEPASFIDKMDSLPGRWMEKEQVAIKDLLHRIFNDPGLFDRFTRKFYDMVANYALDRCRAIAALAPETLPETWPMASIRWCTANLGLANHLGRVASAEKWELRGQLLLKQVMQLDLNLAADFFNHTLVAAHNRYAFSPDVPDSLTRLLGFMEKRHDMQQEFGCVADPCLERIYGTLVQNSAFCGPRHIGQTEALSRKARLALGENYSQELKPEWVRQYHYLGFARLDAGDVEGARICLTTCLGIRDLNMDVYRCQDLTAWQFFLLCRYLAETVSDYSSALLFTSLVQTALKNFTQHHPWQLIFFNLGRAALLRGDREQALRLMQKSFDICLKTGEGPTIEIMALKPLAFLEKIVPAEQFDAGCYGWEKQLRQAAVHLDTHHFSFFHQRTFKEALDHVRKNHDALFPFSYG